MPANSVSDTRRGKIMRGIVAVSVTASAAAFMLFLRSQDIATSDSNTQIVQADGLPAAEPKARAIPATVATADEAAEAKAFVPEAERRPEAVAEQIAIARQEEMQPFIENDKWRIAVVTVNSKDPDEVMRIIESLAAKNGMDIQSVFGSDDHDARFGVLFTSTGVDDNAFIDNVIAETKPQSAAWNPPSIANSSSDRFIHRIQESMKSPTLSELHFGHVYIMTLPKSAKTSAAASEPLVAQHDALEGALLRSAATDKAAASPNEVATAPLVTSARKTPVLLVFEFTDTAPGHI
jgi:hypothetical protein